jgi:hypothetical protein
MKWRRIYILIIILGLVIYLFWGPLFPMSPVKKGYQTIKYTGATLYIQDIIHGDSCVFYLDDILKEEAEIHDLEYRSKIKVIIPGPGTSMKRFLPILRGRSYSVSLSGVNLIYIGTNARTSEYGIEAFLKHELSHMLIGQNAENRKAKLEMQRQSWLVEGIATYYGGPQYHDRESMVALSEQFDLELSELNESNIMHIPSSEIRLRYSFYRHFTLYLIETYGLEKFQLYLKEYIHDPHAYNALFTKVYAEDMESVLASFHAYLIK